jgi:uncharacterized protein (TIGR02444 family)
VTSDLFARIGAIYAQPGLAQRCLHLQDEHGFDVSLGLCALVDGMDGRAWSADRLSALRGAGWDARAAVAGTLRTARRLARPLGADDAEMEALRQRILREELQAERLAVAWLERWLGPPPMPGGADRTTAWRNLRLVAGPNVPQHLLDPLRDVLDG